MEKFMKTRLQTSRKYVGRAYASDEERWKAIVQRDANADGRFFYSVRTTGVYCRPSCAGRRALRENVGFYDSWEDAERAGFRACKRCQPNDAALSEHYAEVVAKACRAIEASEEQPSLDTLAKAGGMSRFHFH